VPRALLARLARPIDVLTETVPCTMVFADVSGFTRLSERLSRRGEEGAEQLVDAINACFSALLAEAYGRGGSLVKFGGDAMLLLFYDQEGDQQHAARACCAAMEMRRILRKAGRIRAGDSDLVLRMSVGLHSGAYGLFVVGGSHRDLLFAGPAASTVATLEDAAGSGQILISPETARRLPRSCVGNPLGPGLHLARAPAACEWVAPIGLPTPPADVVGRFLPVAVRAHLERGSAAPEHRAGTIAFLQFGGVDEVFLRDGNEVVARRLDEVVRLVQEAAERYEVCFLDSDIAADGIKIRLSAGVPRVVGDDEERMLLALRHIIEAGAPFPVRIGVHRGPLFTAHVGPTYRRWYAVMGDTVNLAARLLAKAPPGRIYATREVLRGAKTSFDQHAVEPFAVKGKSRPVQVWEVGRPVRGASDAAIRMELPLVGRDRELAQLEAFVSAARRGSGTVIELVGEAGSGKSRLMAEAGRLAQGMVRLRASCEVYTRDTSYHAWRAPLRALLGLTGEEPPQVVVDRLQAEIESAFPDLLPWLSLIAVVLGVEVAPSVEVERLAAAARAAKLRDVVLRFLSRALVEPTLLEVEQAHVMDAASAALFQALARELETSAWLVLVTRRDTPGGLVLRRAHPRIELGPLSPDDARDLALSAPEALRLPPHVVELAVERSGGSPQFLLDLLAAAAAGDRDHLPASVGAATMARIDALSPADAALVRRAAVLGLSFPAERVADVLDAEMPVPDERAWARLSTVFSHDPSGIVRFRRPALQEVAYASLPFKLRRQLHEAVGLQLERELALSGEREAEAAVLSNHFALAGDHARAQRYALVAARRAAERSAPADAVLLYRRAIDAARASGVVEDPRALAEAWEQMGEELRRAGEPAAARRALREARRMLRDDPIAQARLCDRQAEVAERSEGLTSAVRWLMRGVRSLGELDSPAAIGSRARLNSHLAGIRNRQGRWAEAVLVGRQAIADAEAAGELRALARACYGVDMALRESGRAAEAHHSWRALEIYEQLDMPEEEARVLDNLGMFAYSDGRWDDAIALYRRSRAASERARTPADVARRDCDIGEILSDQGRLEAAAEHLARARRVWSASAERQSVAFVDLLLARLATRRGEARDAVPMLEAAMKELRRFSMDPYASFAEALLAEAEAFGGDPERATRLARDQLELTDRHLPLLARAAGIALARLGRTDEARDELRSALQSARERPSEYDVAATIDVIDMVEGAEEELLRERDAIVARLNITRLPAPALAGYAANGPLTPAPMRQ
jgi:class 3 adenylate cyclase/tetratricopeptide (TPR) repeat protein